MEPLAVSPGPAAQTAAGRGRPGPRRGARAAVALIAVLLVAACGGSGDDTSSEDTDPDVDSSDNPSAVEQPSEPSGSQQAEPYTGYPDSIAVIAHSAATGEGTEPPTGTDTTVNSWATGTNSEVRSVYQRILAKNPDIEGHATNLAVGGATMAAMNGQAQGLSTLLPPPELVLIQTMDNDISCPATAEDYQSFGEDLSTVLDSVEETAPSARVFILTQFGSPETYAAAMSRKQRVQTGQSMGGPGPCAFLNGDGNTVPKELRRLEDIITSYEAKLGEVCEQHELCTWDHGSLSRAVEVPRDINDQDLAHFSIPGHAHVASVTWAALKEQDLIPDR